MRTLKPLFFNVLLILIVKISFAQYYSTGVDPASARWKQIKSEHFQIIFQSDFSEQAQKIANILEYYYELAGKSLDHQPKNISVIVHNQTIQSNGYVAWAPKRMELYATPSQDQIPDPWLEHLCVHEMRHVVQLDKLNQGITKILSVVFGQQATGLVAGQLPMWFYEGDAVCTETGFSDFGRGRIPSFNQHIKTHLLSDEERYSFDKMLFGSYKDFVPNHYEFGYQLTAYAREKYGEKIWSKVENHVAQNSYTLLPTSFAFYRGLKKNTGLSQRELYNETFNYIDSIWTVENLNQKTIQPKFIQRYEIEEYEDYLNPIPVDEGTFIALKKGLSHIPQFVMVSEHSESIIYEPGALISADFSYSNNFLVWAEYKPDIRWENREYNRIRLLNTRTRTTVTLIKKCRYFSPDISKDAKKIVAVDIDTKNKSSLVILESDKGTVLQKIESQPGIFIQRPKWSQDESKIFVIELTDKGKQISYFDLNTNEWNLVFKAENEDIQRIVPSENKIYYHSTLNGMDNVYVFDISSGYKYKLTSSKFGISQFNLITNTNTLLVNEYTSQGNRLSKIPIERALWEKIDDNINYSFDFANNLKKQESVKNEEIIQNKFEEKPYRKSLNLFNFHSWVPAFINYDNITLGSILTSSTNLYNNIYPGIMFFSQNKLSTVESIFGYGYNDGNHYLSSILYFKGIYPEIKLSANYGTPQGIFAIKDVYWIPGTNQGYNYDLEISVPLNLSYGKYISGIRPSVSIDYYDDLYYNFENDYYIKGLEFVQSSLLYYWYKKRSERDIIPKFGGVFTFKLLNTPFDQELFGYLYNIDGVFYIPGGKNKGFKVDIGYQYQKPHLYYFNSNFNFPRGVQKYQTEKLLKFYSDYIFPIAYPDWNLGSVFYLKRIKGDLFLDIAFNEYNYYNSIIGDWISSAGGEFTIDYHLLRMMFPLNTGVRIGYSWSGNFIFAEMLFGINLYQF